MKFISLETKFDCIKWFPRVNKDYLIFINNANSYLSCFYTKTLTKHFSIEEKFEYILNLKDYWFVSKLKSDNSLLLDINGKCLKKIDFEPHILSFYYNDYAYITYRTNNYKKNAKCNIEKLDIIWNTDYNLFGRIIAANELYAISIKEDSTFCLNNSNGELINRFKIGEVLNDSTLKYVSFAGITNNIFIAGLSNNTVVGIDVLTGKLLWQSEPMCENVHIHPQTGKIIAITGKYWELDPLTGKTEKCIRICDMQEIEKPRASPNSISFYEHYIFFAGQANNKIGVFNTQTCETEWWLAIPGCASIPAGYYPQYAQGKLFVTDGKGVLHVLEQID